MASSRTLAVPDGPAAEPSLFPHPWPLVEAALAASPPPGFNMKGAGGGERGCGRLGRIDRSVTSPLPHAVLVAV
eukprot:scaffold79354_cov28-Tisochrysis_lutea.AAC.2